MSRFTVRRWSTYRSGNFQFAIACLSIACLASLSSSSTLAAPSLQPADPLIHRAPTWHPPQVAEVKAQAAAWLASASADAPRRGKALAIIGGISDKANGAELLDRLAVAFAAVDPKVARLVELCSRPRTRIILPTFPWLADPKTPPLVAANMRLCYGRWLVQGQWFEEALEQLGGLKTTDVVAPAELLFYQGVTYHRMLDKTNGLRVINELLDYPEGSPRRYIAVAYLMQSDLNSLEDNTLDHIARRMEIVQTKLNLGRAGPKVRKVEGGVIESLDKMIKRMEDQQNQQNQSQSNSLQSSRPAQDSTPMGGRAPGDVTRRDIGHKSGWGDLPPKEREEALQQISRDFPPHYRDAIEEYFRKLAAEEGSDKDDQ